MQLILVESPTKAKTFSTYLKSGDYEIEATVGHIRDLPAKKIGVDVEHDFKPDYVLDPLKKETIKTIQKLAKKADRIILATDADREGEAISYHIATILGYVDETWPISSVKKTDKIKRIVFHEITKAAIEEALEHPRDINMDLVNAQQARRIVDRIVGYKLSPLLWKKIGKRWLSAGRVQTVAVRFIVEREKEIKKFETEPFYKGRALFGHAKHKDALEAKLIGKGTEKYEQKFTVSLFDGDYTYTKTTIVKDNVEDLEKDIKGDSFTIDQIEEKVSARAPQAPYITSTLQQDAAHKMGYSSKQTMQLAQNLYEKGLITYHRTDSVNLSEKFVAASREYIKKTYGEKYVSKEMRKFTSSNKSAQEAHEAIRPTNVEADIQGIEGFTNRHVKLYEMILKRALSTQMSDALIKSLTITIKGKKGYIFKAKQDEVEFDGFLVLYSQNEYGKITFHPAEGDSVDLNKLFFDESTTQAPPRYSEASLIRTLEKRGIGRPSTYAPIISTIQARNYVEKNEGRFYPTMLGTTVSDYLSEAFKQLFEIDFTAKMELDLDEIAENKVEMVPMLKEFYKPLIKEVEVQEKSDTHIDVQEKTDEKCPDCGNPLLIRFSKFGKFFACSTYPDCKYTKNFVQTTGKKCPKDGGDVIVRFTKRKKRFYGCSNYPKCDFAVWRLNQIEETPGTASGEKATDVSETISDETTTESESTN